MAISYVNSTSFTNGGTSTSSLDFTTPSGITTGDVLILHAGFSSSSVAVTLPAGWTLIRDDNDSGIARKAILAYRIADGTEGATITVTLDSSRRCSGGILALRGVDTTTPIADNAGTLRSTSDTAAVCPSVTAAAADNWLLTFSMTQSDCTATPPASATERWDIGNAAGSGDCTSVCDTEALASSGATGTRTMTLSTARKGFTQSVAVSAAAAASSSATPDGYSQRLDVVLSDANGRRVAANATVTGLDFKTNQNGFADCTITYTIDAFAGYQLYSLNTVWDCKVMDGAATIYHGRVEDVQLRGSTMQVTAFGYYRALSDIPYTALWSAAKYDDWFTENDVTSGNVQYEIKTEDSIYIAPRKNEAFGNVANIGIVRYIVPSNSSRNLATIAFDYKIILPANWNVDLVATNAAFNTFSIVWTLAGTNALQTGNVSVTTLNNQSVYFQVYNNTGALYSYTNDTGARYAKFSNVRLKTTTSSTVTTATIASDMVAQIAATNSSQLSSSTTLLNSTGVDLTDAVYEDANMADVLQQLADQGDSSGNKYEVGVYLNKQLYFRQKGSAGRTWFVRIEDLDVERSIEDLVNSAYISYRDANDTTIRTSATSNTASVARYGLTRCGYAQLDSTSATQASAAQAALLTDQANPFPKAKISFSHVYGASGGQYPLYYIRSGDTIVIKNMPPNLGSFTDRIRQFRVSETAYNAASDTIDVTPEMPLPSLDRILANT